MVCWIIFLNSEKCLTIIGTWYRQRRYDTRTKFRWDVCRYILAKCYVFLELFGRKADGLYFTGVEPTHYLFLNYRLPKSNSSTKRGNLYQPLILIKIQFTRLSVLSLLNSFYISGCKENYIFVYLFIHIIKLKSSAACV